MFHLHFSIFENSFIFFAEKKIRAIWKQQTILKVQKSKILPRSHFPRIVILNIWCTYSRLLSMHHRYCSRKHFISIIHHEYLPISILAKSSKWACWVKGYAHDTADIHCPIVLKNTINLYYQKCKKFTSLVKTLNFLAIW